MATGAWQRIAHTATTVVAVVASLVASAPMAGAAEPSDFFRDATPLADLRLRAEHVDQEGPLHEADALTLRARVGVESGKAWGWTLTAESELAWPLRTDYNSTTNGKTSYAVVADPESQEINRLALTNTSLERTTFTLGRQRILHDAQRFVGSSDWRQNEQTFDAVRVATEPFRNLHVDLAYASQVNRVFGSESPVGRFTGDNYLANVAWQFSPVRVTAFTYLLDLEQAATESTATYGLKLAASEHPIGALKVGGTLSYAVQSDRAGNPLDFRHEYLAAELATAVAQASLLVGFELLEGDDSHGFSTPLAALHKFQGWADKFLVTPPAGIEDRYAAITYAPKGNRALSALSATVAYHSYRADRGAARLGDELNLLVQVQHKRWKGIVKYAAYQAESFATDTDKLWAQLEYRY